MVELVPFSRHPSPYSGGNVREGGPTLRIRVGPGFPLGDETSLPGQDRPRLWTTDFSGTQDFLVVTVGPHVVPGTEGL